MKQATNFDWIRQMILDKVEKRMKNNSNNDSMTVWQNSRAAKEPALVFI